MKEGSHNKLDAINQLQIFSSKPDNSRIDSPCFRPNISQFDEMSSKASVDNADASQLKPLFMREDSVCSSQV
jgi:hypothetical protein